MMRVAEYGLRFPMAAKRYLDLVTLGEMHNPHIGTHNITDNSGEVVNCARII